MEVKAIHTIKLQIQQKIEAIHTINYKFSKTQNGNYTFSKLASFELTHWYLTRLLQSVG